MAPAAITLTVRSILNAHPKTATFHRGVRRCLTAGSATAKIPPAPSSTQLSYTATTNSNFYLLTAGPDLSKHASFSPIYDSAKPWIHSHPVGPTLIDPAVVLGGLVTKVQAWIPGVQVRDIGFRAGGDGVKPFIVGEVVSLDLVVDGAEREEEGKGWMVDVRGEGRRKRAEGDEEVVCSADMKLWVGEHVLNRREG